MLALPFLLPSLLRAVRTGLPRLIDCERVEAAASSPVPGVISKHFAARLCADHFTCVDMCEPQLWECSSAQCKPMVSHYYTNICFNAMVGQLNLCDLCQGCRVNFTAGVRNNLLFLNGSSSFALVTYYITFKPGDLQRSRFMLERITRTPKLLSLRCPPSASGLYYLLNSTLGMI